MKVNLEITHSKICLWIFVKNICEMKIVSFCHLFHIFSSKYSSHYSLLILFLVKSVVLTNITKSYSKRCMHWRDPNSKLMNQLNYVYKMILNMLKVVSTIKSCSLLISLPSIGATLCIYQVVLNASNSFISGKNVWCYIKVSTMSSIWGWYRGIFMHHFCCCLLYVLR